VRLLHDAGAKHGDARDVFATRQGFWAALRGKAGPEARARARGVLGEMWARELRQVRELHEARMRGSQR
jgi:hypothetical protein